MKLNARLIAFYLPQFHPIPENDEWWGKGFTEWTNTAKAKPLFFGHYQPHIPADFGFYDLRVPEIRIAQAEMAHTYGIEAFCYYHYWFAGKQLLERPLNEVIASGEPNFPFCICWANQTWTGIWHGAPNRILIEQTYPGVEDHQEHFETLLPAFSDERYLTVDGKALFLIYYPTQIPDIKRTTDLWREMAVKAGLKGLYLVGTNQDDRRSWKLLYDDGFDAVSINLMPGLRPWISRRHPIKWARKKYEYWSGKPTIYSYKEILPHLLFTELPHQENYPCVFPNWDNTPRSGVNGLVLHNSTPELFRIHLKEALNLMRDVPTEHRLIFIKSWNEWAEGNHLEPDLKFGKQYLEVIRNEVITGV